MPSRGESSSFCKAGAQVFALSQVVQADFSRIEQLQVSVSLTNGSQLTLTDIDALEFAMRVKPSVLESRRLRWPKFAWAVHNLIGHPVMQLLAFVGAYRWAFRVHDDTVPRPLGAKGFAEDSAKTSSVNKP